MNEEDCASARDHRCTQESVESGEPVSAPHQLDCSFLHAPKVLLPILSRLIKVTPLTHTSMSFTDHTPITSKRRYLLAHLLEPVLKNCCNGCLGEITWFKSWSSSGAATGSSDLVRMPAGAVKSSLNFPLARPNIAGHRNWATRDQGAHAPASLPVDPNWAGTTLDRRGTHYGEPIRRACSRAMHDVIVAASNFTPMPPCVPALRSGPAKPLDWEGTRQARDVCHIFAIADAQRWNEAVKHRQSPPPSSWPAGTPARSTAGARRSALPETFLRLAAPRNDVSPASRLDLAMVHPGHWIERGVSGASVLGSARLSAASNW